MRKFLRLLTITLVGGVSLAVGIVGLALPVNAVLSRATSSIPNPLVDIFKQQAEESVVYANDGSVLAVLSAAINRTPVPLAQVPQTLIDAVVDTEDARFFTHGAIDVKSTVRALASDVKSGATVQGASTITQQLVKTVLNTPEKTLSRKIKDAVIADRLEQRYSKDQILEAYLNAVYFGNGAYGVDAAAQTYFNENVSQVTTVQAALLAGMIRNPVGYDPILNPNDSTARRNYVLGRMVTQGDLTASAAAALSTRPVPAKLTLPRGTANNIEDYYVAQVKNILLDNTTILGSTYSDRYNALFEGGLKIYTNLDPRMQAAADSAVAQDFPAYDSKHGFATALASIDPATGDVRAIVGGPGFDKLKFDLTTAQRQPGSGFKLFTLLAAYEAGFNPNDTIDGSSPCAVAFPGDNSLLKNPIHNDGNESFGMISLATAFADSVNCAFVRLAAQVGMPKVIEMAHRLGLSEHFDPYPAVVIGAEETTVLEMADAYSAVDAGGMYHQTSFVNRIVGADGDTIYTANTTGKRVLTAQIAAEAVQTMRGVVQFGTAAPTGNLPDRQSAGKTGTTEYNTDAWFNGVTMQLATSVWMGDITGRTPMVYPNTLIDEFGADTPTVIWRDYTEAALAGQPAIPFPEPNPSLMPAQTTIGQPQQATTSVLPATGTSATTVPTATTSPTVPVITVPIRPPPTIPPITRPTTPTTSCIPPPSIPGHTFPSPPFCR